MTPAMETIRAWCVPALASLLPQRVCFLEPRLPCLESRFSCWGYVAASHDPVAMDDEKKIRLSPCICAGALVCRMFHGETPAYAS